MALAGAKAINGISGKVVRKIEMLTFGLFMLEKYNGSFYGDVAVKLLNALEFVFCLFC